MPRIWSLETKASNTNYLTMYCNSALSMGKPTVNSIILTSIKIRPKMPKASAVMDLGPSISPYRNAARTATVRGCESMITCSLTTYILVAIRKPAHQKICTYPKVYSNKIHNLVKEKRRTLTLPSPAVIFVNPSAKHPCTTTLPT
jgi:hypothetical protein